jgi:hypothetical protein
MTVIPITQEVEVRESKSKASSGKITNLSEKQTERTKRIAH